MKTSDVKNDPQVNIIFMTYRLEADADRPGEFKPVLVNVEGTSHTNLQNAIMYKDPPQRSAFTAQIKSSLVRGAVRLARSEEHTSELQSLMRISYAVFSLNKKRQILNQIITIF